MTKPILCFDLDGTVIDHQGQIHPKDAALLHEPDGREEFIVATGRSYSAMLGAFRKNGLFTDGLFPYPAVVLNGAQLSSMGGATLGFFPFPPEVQQQVIQLAEKIAEDVTLLFLDQNDVHIVRKTDEGIRRADKYEFLAQPFTEQSRNCSFCKLMCLSEDITSLKRIESMVNGLEVESAYSMPTIFELTPMGVNKGSGLMKLLKNLQFEGRNLYAAGDGGNDLPMLKMANKSFTAMTSPEYIKDQVDHVIDTEKNGLLTPMLEIIFS